MSTIPSQSNSTASSAAQTSGHSKLNGTSHCPIESIFEILLRLPIKPLLRCRCVCKSWCSLIDSKKFVDKHLQRNTECSPDSEIVFRAHSEVCLWQNDIDILLWNPATRKVRVLPTPTNVPIPFMLMGSDAVGFGYDHLNDDYKVVRFVDSQIQGIMVTVYSLKRNSWTRAETITNRIRLRMNFGFFNNGALYWLATKDTHIIVAFDLGVERHRELPLPDGVDKTDGHPMGLIVFDRCLCLIDQYRGSRMDIWMKNDNGMENSWSKVICSGETRHTRIF
ncbi:hypothetical protein POM88_042074 [Heracleum sosnowskyi]|uniref:F-box domain-containing protein n=1 Tax=Heracleum sosnowskyi TaxID=360622 RepID=A0AAD8MBW0_9APIA|nr:hypothetical protein POM88_042074 [Heracleum sosnowskyi]